MGICPQCGSFVDEGEPYCPDCSYIFGDDSEDDDFIRIDGDEYRKSDVVDVLRDYDYDLDDLEYDNIDEEDFEEILEDLRFK